VILREYFLFSRVISAILSAIFVSTDERRIWTPGSGHGQYMKYNLPILYRGDISNTVSTVATTTSYGTITVNIKPVMCPNLEVES
jgi:hypothetical protein